MCRPIISRVASLFVAASILFSVDAHVRAAEPASAESGMAAGAEAYRVGDFGTAIEHWSDAERLARESGDVDARVNALLNLGAAYQASGQYKPLALLRLNDAWNLVEGTDRKREWLAVENAMGAVYTAVREPESARAKLDQALALADEI